MDRTTITRKEKLQKILSLLDETEDIDKTLIRPFYNYIKEKFNSIP